MLVCLLLSILCFGSFSINIYIVRTTCCRISFLIQWARYMFLCYESTSLHRLPIQLPCTTSNPTLLRCAFYGIVISSTDWCPSTTILSLISFFFTDSIHRHRLYCLPKFLFSLNFFTAKNQM